MQQGHTQPKQTPAPFGKQSTADGKLSVIRQSSNLVLTERIIFGPGVSGEADFISWKNLSFLPLRSSPQILYSYLTQLLVGIKFSQQITANHLSPWEAIPCNCQGRVRHFIPALCQMAKKLHSAAPRLTSCSPESPVTTVDFIRRKPPWPTLNSIDLGEAHPWPPKLPYQSPTTPRLGNPAEIQTDSTQLFSSSIPWGVTPCRSFYRLNQLIVIVVATVSKYQNIF